MHGESAECRESDFRLGFWNVVRIRVSDLCRRKTVVRDGLADLVPVPFRCLAMIFQ